MRTAPRHSNRPSRVLRVVAVGAAWMVMTLGLTSASPQLHAWIHGDFIESGCAAHSRCPSSEPGSDASSPADAHTCAVTLFAQGVLTPAAVFIAAPCEEAWRAPALRAIADLALTPPRYLHRPPQAPPVV